MVWRDGLAIRLFTDMVPSVMKPCKLVHELLQPPNKVQRRSKLASPGSKGSNTGLEWPMEASSICSAPNRGLCTITLIRAGFHSMGILPMPQASDSTKRTRRPQEVSVGKAALVGLAGRWLSRHASNSKRSRRLQRSLCEDQSHLHRLHLPIQRRGLARLIPEVRPAWAMEHPCGTSLITRRRQLILQFTLVRLQLRQNSDCSIRCTAQEVLRGSQ